MNINMCEQIVRCSSAVLYTLLIIQQAYEFGAYFLFERISVFVSFIQIEKPEAFVTK